MSSTFVDTFEPRRFNSVAAPSTVEGTVFDFRDSKASGIFKAYKTMRAELTAVNLRLTEGDQTYRGGHSYLPASSRHPAALYLDSLATSSFDPVFSIKTTLEFDSFSHGVYRGHYSMSVVRGPKEARGRESGTFTLAIGAGTNQVKGIVFDDTNSDGKRVRSETPVAGATVWADLDEDNRWDRDEPRVFTIRDGSYTIKRVPAGWERTIRCTVPGEWTLLDQSAEGFTMPVRSDGNILKDVNFSAGRDTWLRGSIRRDVDADGVPSAGDRVWPGTSTVWADIDRDGLIDADEPQAVNRSGRFTLHGNVPAGTPVRFHCDFTTVVAPRKRAYVFTSDIVHATKVDFLVR